MKNLLKISIYNAFSSMELIIVIAIIGIITYSFFFAYPEYLAKVQVSNALSILQSYRKKAEVFYLDHNTINNGFDSLTSISQLDNAVGSNDLGYNLSSVVLTKNSNSSITLTGVFNGKNAVDIRDENIKLEIKVDELGVFSAICSGSTTLLKYLPKDCIN